MLVLLIILKQAEEKVDGIEHFMAHLVYHLWTALYSVIVKIEICVPQGFNPTKVKTNFGADTS